MSDIRKRWPLFAATTPMIGDTWFDGATSSSVLIDPKTGSSSHAKARRRKEIKELLNNHASPNRRYDYFI
jgi:hypothetical protein